MRSSPWVKGHWILVSAALLPLVVLPARAADIPSTPQWVQDAVERLKTLRVLPLWMGTTRPLTFADLRAGLLAEGQVAVSLAPGDQVLLERLRHEAGLDSTPVAKRGSLHGGKLGLVYGVDRGYVSLAGVPLLDREWAFGWAVDSPTAALRLGGEESSFLLGRERLGWGPGEEGGLLFSDAAGPFERMQYSTTWWGIRYTKLVGWLDGGRSLEAARMDWMIRPNVRLGFSESILMLGEPYWVFMLQPVPILINQIISNTYRRPQGFDDNYFASADIEWIPRAGLRLYGELLLDDFTLPPNPYPWRWGATLGVQSVHPGGRSLLLQYTIVSNWTYSATNPGLHYLLRGLPVAHPLGADFDALHVRWRASPDRPLAVWMTYIRKGEGEVGRIWTDLTEATAYPFLRGVVEYSTILGLDLVIQGEWTGTVSPWIRYRENAGHMAGMAETDWGVGLSFQGSF